MSLIGWIADKLEGDNGSNQKALPSKDAGIVEVEFGAKKVEQEKIAPETVDRAVKTGLLGEKSDFLKTLDVEINSIFKAYTTDLRLQAETFMVDVSVRDGVSVECVYFVYSQRVRPTMFKAFMESKNGEKVIADFESTLIANEVSFATLNGNKFNVAKMIIMGRMRND